MGPVVPQMSHGKRRACVLTLAQNEPVVLPLWWRYYRQHVPERDLYCISHDCTDGSTDLFPQAQRWSVHNDCYGDIRAIWQWRTTARRELHERYEYVILADSDEFICHPAGLRTFIRAADDWAYAQTAYHVLHGDGEASYDPEVPVLRQRRRWVYDALYCCPHILRDYRDYRESYHLLEGEEQPFPRTDLLMVHLIKFDRGLAYAKRARLREKPQTTYDAEARNCWQDRLEGDEIEEWLRMDEERAEQIPEWVKEQVNV